MKLLKHIVCVVLSISAVLVVVHGLSAQEDATSPSISPLKMDAIEGVPPAALLTARGRQLANNLANLRRSRQVLGSKHPTLPSINAEIMQIEELLADWAPAPPESNPFQKGQDGERQSKLNDYDLRQMVIQLSAKIDALEQRVARLEGKI